MCLFAPKTAPGFALKIAPPWEPDYGPYLGCFIAFLLLFSVDGRVFVTITVIAGFQNVAMMGQPVQKRSRQFCITEHISPFWKAQISRDDHAGSFVQFAEQMEQQRTASLAERQITQFIQNDEISMGKAVGQSTLIAIKLFLFKWINEFNRW